MSIPQIPETAPFTLAQRAWLNGYLLGLVGTSPSAPSPLALPEIQNGSSPVKKSPLLVLYGSQTGNAEQLARRIAAESARHGYQSECLELDALPNRWNSGVEDYVVITSTWGDGDPPDNAAGFWSWIQSETAPSLSGRRYSVLALGDSTYSEFCGFGKKCDARLSALGASRILDRTECDADYDAVAAKWIESLWQAFQANGHGGVRHSENPDSRPSAQASSNGSTAPLVFDRKNPFPARFLANRRLNREGSSKDTRHFEISLAGSNLNYVVGDALAVQPCNFPRMVEELIHALGLVPEIVVPTPTKGETSLRDALLTHYEVTKPPLKLLEELAARKPDVPWQPWLVPDQKSELERYLYGRETIDLLMEAPNSGLSAVQFVSLLRKLPARSYSIASSLKAHPDEVHLTVAVVRYESHGRLRHGVCSTFLADRTPDNAPVPVYVQTSNGFRIPEESGRSMIMIGPGTGIAPFRAFLEERRAIGAVGRHWVFFGDRQADCDFLYQEEFEAMKKDGILHELDTAFSRDQAQRIYVQNRMLERSAMFWKWLEEGAHVYVCGDAKRMAKDVDAALHRIVEQEGGRSAEAAEAYVRELKKDRRYQRDVY
ncbi:MAG: sulfite reductase subunit alpha [Verrucomicrobia bacterium]|nr:sulfite reductase subunit alpha [Verrucomicrobiota bacterium]